jgi:hypothetical protein
MNSTDNRWIVRVDRAYGRQRSNLVFANEAGLQAFTAAILDRRRSKRLRHTIGDSNKEIPRRHAVGRRECLSWRALSNRAGLDRPPIANSSITTGSKKAGTLRPGSNPISSPPSSGRGSDPYARMSDGRRTTWAPYRPRAGNLHLRGNSDGLQLEALTLLFLGSSEKTCLLCIVPTRRLE